MPEKPNPHEFKRGVLSAKPTQHYGNDPWYWDSVEMNGPCPRTEVIEAKLSCGHVQHFPVTPPEGDQVPCEQCYLDAAREWHWERRNEAIASWQRIVKEPEDA